MSIHFPELLAGTAAAPALMPVNLANITAKQLACLVVAPPAHLLIDCGGLLMPHPLGVGRFVALLLQMRQRGTCLRLCNVHPGLRRYLQQLGLEAVFYLNG
ncbi:STAS domain-containing protein [Hymenobacter sp. IS2118]|uniref:STAS domain-containing protein n=1 Tax=Hymenobacter sp. IS2118 TaxID=1505605 RepID=UPI000B1F8389|nr:STAS domain-containing protein [Hymenobacter sp. IS2118]